MRRVMHLLHGWNRPLVIEVAWMGLSRMKGNFHVRFLGGWKGSNALSYPLQSAAVHYQQRFRRTKFCCAFCCYLVHLFFNRVQFRGLTSNEFPACGNTRTLYVTLLDTSCKLKRKDEQPKPHPPLKTFITFDKIFQTISISSLINQPDKDIPFLVDKIEYMEEPESIVYPHKHNFY